MAIFEYVVSFYGVLECHELPTTDVVTAALV